MKKFAAVGVFGRANAGKSTLVNALVGEQVSIVSKRPQTTRKRILGILTQNDAQLVFCDTPGLHRIKNRLDAYMQEEIVSTMRGLQLGLYLVDLADIEAEEDQDYLSQLKTDEDCPMILVLNKTDLVSEDILAEAEKTYAEFFSFDHVFKISAKEKLNIDQLLEKLIELAPDGPHAFDAEMYTSQSEREIVEEVIREIALKKYRQEIPHSMAVQVEQFKERENGKTFIEAVIHVEKDGQKKIVIGSGGRDIKELGLLAREKLNSLLERDIFLELWVKVRSDWRKSDSWIERLGYTKSL